MRRTIWKDLLNWKYEKDRKPLIIRGARQVGKTWLMQEFGRLEYEDVIYLNCDDEPRASDLFAANYNMERILLQLQAISGINPRPGKTLIILDELQAIPRGLASLKYFYEKIPQYQTSQTHLNVVYQNQIDILLLLLQNPMCPSKCCLL